MGSTWIFLDLLCMFSKVFLDFVRSSLNPTFEGRHDVCAYCVIWKGLNSRRLLYTTKPYEPPFFLFEFVIQRKDEKRVSIF